MKMFRPCLLLAALLLLPGCRWIGFTWGPPEGYSRSAGNIDRQRYISWPGDGATGVQLVPTIQWRRDRLKEDLKGLTRLVVTIATPDGKVIYRVTSNPGDPEKSWLLHAKSVRLFSRPRGTSVQADPEFTELGRLKPASTYQLSLHARNQQTRVFETLTFETLDLK